MPGQAQVGGVCVQAQVCWPKSALPLSLSHPHPVTPSPCSTLDLSTPPPSPSSLLRSFSMYHFSPSIFRYCVGRTSPHRLPVPPSSSPALHPGPDSSSLFSPVPMGLVGVRGVFHALRFWERVLLALTVEPTKGQWQLCSKKQ